MMTSTYLLFYPSSDVYKDSGLVNNFEELIINLFEPLFEVTNDPSSHPELHSFLQYVSCKFPFHQALVILILLQKVIFIQISSSKFLI